MRILNLIEKARWYDMIERLEKHEDYRAIKPYWTKRIGIYDAVRLRYGYTKRSMLFECRGIRVGKGNPELGAPPEDVYIIKLGKRIE